MEKAFFCWWHGQQQRVPFILYRVCVCVCASMFEVRIYFVSITKSIHRWRQWRRRRTCYNQLCCQGLFMQKYFQFTTKWIPILCFCLSLNRYMFGICCMLFGSFLIRFVYGVCADEWNYRIKLEMEIFWLSECKTKRDLRSNFPFGWKWMTVKQTLVPLDIRLTKRQGQTFYVCMQWIKYSISVSSHSWFR